mgnify:CR=1 FL=1
MICQCTVFYKRTVRFAGCDDMQNKSKYVPVCSSIAYRYRVLMPIDYIRRITEFYPCKQLPESVKTWYPISSEPDLLLQLKPGPPVIIYNLAKLHFTGEL